MTPATITISGEGSELIERLRAGMESRELIDLFGLKFAGVKLEIYTHGDPHAVMLADEVTEAQPASWSGDGMPPVGAVCTHMDGIERFRVFAVDGAYAAIASEYTRFWCPVDDLRQIKTPAQIAAEEREAAIEAIEQVTGLRSRDGRRAVALSIYEAGYRLTKGDDK